MTTGNKQRTTKKYYVDCSGDKVVGGQHESGETLTEIEVEPRKTEHEGNALYSYNDAADKLLENKYRQLDGLDEQRSDLLAEIDALEQAESFDEYRMLIETHQAEATNCPDCGVEPGQPHADDCDRV